MVGDGKRCRRRAVNKLDMIVVAKDRCQPCCSPPGHHPACSNSGLPRSGAVSGPPTTHTNPRSPGDDLRFTTRASSSARLRLLLLGGVVEQVLEDILQARLDEEKKLGEQARVMITAACRSDEALAEALGGEAIPGETRLRPETVDGRYPAFLQSIRVEGFRGVGPAATLEISPGPGLTLVVGRNGSGKSSFAEALELLLTEDSRRWSHRSAVWKEGWRNVHHAARTRLRADLIVDGQAAATTCVRSWAAGDDLSAGTVAVQRAGEPRADLETLGWRRALVRYRPFLSYNELGTMFDAGPTKLYETLALVLGLEELTDAEKALKAARLDRSRLFDGVAGDL